MREASPASLLRLHRDAGLAAYRFGAVRERHKDAAAGGVERYRAARACENSEGWGRILSDRRRDCRQGRLHARARRHAGLTEHDRQRQGSTADIGGNRDRIGRTEIVCGDGKNARVPGAVGIHDAVVLYRRPEGDDVGNCRRRSREQHGGEAGLNRRGRCITARKVKCYIQGGIAALGVKAMTKLCDPLLPGMSTGVFAIPVTALVF